MGGERKFNTRRGMGSSAAGRVQHSQDISWQNRQKTPGLVRPQRPGATDSYKDACRLLQKRTCALKSDWWERKAVELQRAADSNNMKGFYNGLKEVCGPKKKAPVQLISTYGMETFSDSKIAVARWSEHIQKLLNVPGDIDHEALDNMPQRIIKTSLDDIPTMEEMARAIAGLKDGKAPRGDGIPAEVWKRGGDNLFSRLHQLITNAWEMGSVPQAWKDASIVTIYKKEQTVGNIEESLFFPQQARSSPGSSSTDYLHT